MHDREAIRSIRESGTTIRAIACEVGASTNAVLRAIAPDAQLSYRRGSRHTEYTDDVARALDRRPRLSVREIAELVEWPGSRRSLSELVRQLRPAAIRRECERLGLVEPAVGTMQVGTMRVGQMQLGTVQAEPIRDLRAMRVGRVDTSWTQNGHNRQHPQPVETHQGEP